MTHAIERRYTEAHVRGVRACGQRCACGRRQMRAISSGGISNEARNCSFSAGAKKPRGIHSEALPHGLRQRYFCPK